MRLGMVLVLHTFGSDLKWHPHLHLLVTEGGLSLDGRRWVRPYGDGWLMAHGALKRRWRYHVVRALRRAHRAGDLRFPESASFLAEYPRFNALLRRRDPGFPLRYIGRYTKRAVLAEYRITHYDPERGVVRFAFRDDAEGGKTSFKTLPVQAFLGRLIRHIPDKSFKTVRYAGIFAPRWREHYLAHARAALAQPRSPRPEPPTPAISLLSWQSGERPQGTIPCSVRAAVCPCRSSASSLEPTSPSPSCFEPPADLWRRPIPCGTPDEPALQPLHQGHLFLYRLSCEAEDPPASRPLL